MEKNMNLNSVMINRLVIFSMLTLTISACSEKKSKLDECYVECATKNEQPIPIPVVPLCHFPKVLNQIDNSCVDIIRSCPIDRGSGTQFFTGNQYSSCTLNKCNIGTIADVMNNSCSEYINIELQHTVYDASVESFVDFIDDELMVGDMYRSYITDNDIPIYEPNQKIDIKTYLKLGNNLTEIYSTFVYISGSSSERLSNAEFTILPDYNSTVHNAYLDYVLDPYAYERPVYVTRIFANSDDILKEISNFIRYP